MPNWFWVAHSAWRYRKELIAGVQTVAEMRKSAKDFTREYIRRRVKHGFVAGLAQVLFQIVLLLGALLLVVVHPTLFSRLVASALLWAITAFNLYRFFMNTIPELRAVRKTLRSKTHHALKYFLRISIATELMQWNLLLPTLCLATAVLTRSAIGTNVSYFAPWIEAFQKLNSLH